MANSLLPCNSDLFQLSWMKTSSSVVKSRWLCYFQESRNTCQKFYFSESRRRV